MRPRIRIFIATGLIILLIGIAFFTFSIRSQESVEVFPATINRDCAPWDGPAFTIFIPIDQGSSIYISIWQFPEFRVPVTYQFPDETMQIGNATYVLEVSHSEQLTGRISFGSIMAGRQVEGAFGFVTETGKQLKGKFEARWGNEVAYCG